MEQKNVIHIPPPAVLAPLPLIPFTTEGIIGCTNEAAKRADKAPRNPPPSFFYFMFYCFSKFIVNTPKSTKDFMILISLISSFKINQVNPFPVLTAHFPLIFPSYLFIVF